MKNAPFLSPSLPSESEQIRYILSHLDWDNARAERVQTSAALFINAIRNAGVGVSEIENFLQHYPLSSVEGRALMTLAEALLRIPDSATADVLIAEKIGASDWKKMVGGGLFGTLTSTGLGVAKSMLGGFLSGVSKPVIRKATEETVRRLGAQFVVGESIESALKIAEREQKNGYRMSFDMLGEGARTEEDAERYFNTYAHAARMIGDANDMNVPLELRHGMSVKLSALHPRYSWTHQEICVPPMVEKLRALCHIAKEKGFGLTVDAEESERLEISLAIIAAVARDPTLKGWDGFGLAVQAYDRRAPAVIDYISALIDETGQKLQVRLVKGAYWDGEIKRAQMAGWDDYAVYTRKDYTDLAYLYVAQKMLMMRHKIYPMFATHNAVTAAAILHMAGSDRTGFECQRLYGMGGHLGMLLRQHENIPVTYYAPVGSYHDLLPYLVRRMLENGANTSFVSQIRNSSITPESLARDCVSEVRDGLEKPPALPLPRHLYEPDRKNSRGIDMSRATHREAILSSLRPPLVNVDGEASPAVIDNAFARAKIAFSSWNAAPAKTRAHMLRSFADRMDDDKAPWIALLQDEGKKTFFDALAEVREAIDFCRYYATEGESLFNPEGQRLNSYTGEKNILKMTGRGVFVAISPWNFPLAIFLGQVVAALMAGNSVIAKPAEQTPKIAYYAVQCLYDVGIPRDVLHLLQGDGKVGAALVAHRDVAGVVFTGSTDVARRINQTLANKPNAPIIPLIAETGGQNVMMVDSTALLEQVLDDVLVSAFGSAGQRCSALRVLYIQDDVADSFIKLLRGALPLLHVGSPHDLSTDVPPVIDAEARDKLITHKNYLDGFATFIASAPLPKMVDDTYVAPCAYEIDSLSRLPAEVFGPILHLIRYAEKDTAQVIDAVNQSGYGLTFGLHSRLSARHKLVAEKIRAGNIYINRTMIGAVVGVQPFGGMGLSGTGPKAGGPHYLHRFATEITVTDNIMASGGNIDLLAGADG